MQDRKHRTASDAKPSHWTAYDERFQVAALPVRLAPSGKKQALLVTTRSGRWTPPKGWPMRGVPHHKAAAREAFEEGGVAGLIAARPIAQMAYSKRLACGRKVVCRALVFPLTVTHIAKSWPEQHRRRRKWVDLDQVARLTGLLIAPTA